MVLSHLAGCGVARISAAVLGRSSAPSPEPRPAALAVDVPDPLARAARAHGAPLHILDAPVDVLRLDERPDLIVTACFPARLPGVVLRTPRAGCLNLHPSLLPAYRGPSPIFWQLRDGASRGGVTVHKLDDALDTGDIVAAQACEIPLGATAAELTRDFVDAGARLLVAALARAEWHTLPGTPQDDARASYHPWPRPEHFRLQTSSSAERAFRFMRGTSAWGQPYVVDMPDARLSLERAVAFDASAQLPRAWAQEGDRLHVACKPGVLRAVGRAQPFTPRGAPRRAAGRASTPPRNPA